MTFRIPNREPYHVTPRFYRAMQSKVLKLQVDALCDELVAVGITNADQLRRQRLLIQAQRDEADRLRDFLSFTTVQQARDITG